MEKGGKRWKKVEKGGKRWKKSKKGGKSRKNMGKSKASKEGNKTLSRNVVLVERVDFRVNAITEAVFGTQNGKSMVNLFIRVRR